MKLWERTLVIDNNSKVNRDKRNMAEQFEAAILQNFLLVQADKHGHQLLAALPGIAGQV